MVDSEHLLQGYIVSDDFVTCCSVADLCLTLVTPWTAAHQASLSFAISQSLLNSHPSHQRCHPNISSPVAAFSSCPQSFQASESFPMSQLFESGGQSIITQGPYFKGVYFYFVLAMLYGMWDLSSPTRV